MNAFDRAVVAAIAAMFALLPLYGTFSVLAVQRPPIAPLVGRPFALAVAGVLAVAIALVTAGAIRRRSRPATLAAMIANVIATYVGAAFGFDPAIGILLATAVAGFVATHLALLAYYREPGTARAIYGALLASGLLASVAAVAMVALKRPADLYVYNHGRAVATFLNPNEFASYLLAYIAAACGIAIVRRGTRFGAFAAACAIVASAALALTFSRWGLVSALAGVVIFAAGTRTKRAFGVAALALTLAGALNFALGDRHHDPQDTDARSVAWRAGFATFAHFPLTGVGPLAFERLYPVMRTADAPGSNTPVAYDPHDLPLSIMAETGLFGIAAFAAFFVVFGRTLRRALAGSSREGRVLALALLAGLVAVGVHALLNSVSIAFALFAQFAALALAAAYWGFEPHAA